MSGVIAERDEELDMSPEEWNLSLSDPVGYAWNVDGVRLIAVKDESVERRYIYKGGEVEEIRMYCEHGRIGFCEFCNYEVS